VPQGKRHIAASLAPSLHPYKLQLAQPVERWFAELTERRLRRGVFTSVSDLVDAITSWATCWNNDPKAFIWHKAGDEITEKVRRGRATLHQIKSATYH
jgi:hypothetical protein